MGGYYFSAENGTVTSTQALDNPYRDDVTVDNAPFIQNQYLEQVITDTHYDDPDRKGRHLTFLARIAEGEGVLAKGIACEERTAVCIDENGIAKVYGNDTENDIAYFVNANCQLENGFPENCAENEPLTWCHSGEALKVYEVYAHPNGENSFDLNDWQTGEGGEWKEWSADQGELVIADSTPAECSVTVSELEQNNLIRIYPNPSNGIVTITGIQNEKNTRISISDMAGKQVYEQVGDFSELLNLDILPVGAYMLTITDGNSVHVERLLIN